MYGFYDNPAKSWISATVLPDRILNPACPPGTAPCCGPAAAKPAEDGPFPLSTSATYLHCSPYWATKDHHQPPGLSWFNWVGTFAANQSSHRLKLRNAEEHSAFFFVSWFASLPILSHVLWKVNHGFTGRKQQQGGRDTSVLASWPQKLHPMWNWAMRPLWLIQIQNKSCSITTYSDQHVLSVFESVTCDVKWWPKKSLGETDIKTSWEI